MDGVCLDPLTEGLLEIASDPELGRGLDESLRDFFHDARNRLSHLKLNLYLARQAPEGEPTRAWNEVDQSYVGLEALLERVASICGPSRSVEISGRLGSWLEERRGTWSAWLGSKGRSLDWAAPPCDPLGRFDPKRLIEGLDALISWRSMAGGQDEPARLAWGFDGGNLSIVWTESDARIEDPIEGRESRALSMAFPLLARVMADHGGVLVVSVLDGLSVRLTWPGSIAAARPA